MPNYFVLKISCLALTLISHYNKTKLPTISGMRRLRPTAARPGGWDSLIQVASSLTSLTNALRLAGVGLVPRRAFAEAVDAERSALTVVVLEAAPLANVPWEKE